ncbi:MAG: molybdopterin-dependent oxidoreductase [Candidatus Poribacteria bacterium]|nr:molybdopterin-dependent oxidoreductase [Candidatus Poribacteria bacterium]
MAKIIMDGQEYEVSDGISVVQAAAEVGVTIPHYCYHPSLGAPANCRMCLIELTPPGAPGPIRQLTTACTTRVGDGMEISNSAPRVKQARATTLQFLLAHHPLDCPTCDEAGECFLQDYAYEFGHDRSVYQEIKNVPPRKSLGPTVDLFTTRCIVCTRCVRFTEEISGGAEIGLMHRGVHDEIDVAPDKPLDNKLSGNVVDICPVGALVSKDFLYRSRPWFLTKKPSVCNRCSKGCNIHVESREGEVARLRPRYHADVNDFWMCDDGRFGYEYVNSPDRLRLPALRKDGELIPAGWRELLETAAEKIQALGGEQTAVITSAWMTNEELYAVKRLAEEGVGTERIGLFEGPVEDEDEVFPKFVIERDKNPNRAGAELIFGDGLKTAAEALDGAKAAVFFGGIPGAPLDDALMDRLTALEYLLTVDILPSALTEAADAAAPGTAFTEKEGCFTNSAKRVQRLSKALPNLGNALAEWQFAAYLANALGANIEYESAAQITDDLASTVAAFHGAVDEAIDWRGFCLEEKTDGGEAEETAPENWAYASRFWR